MLALGLALGIAWRLVFRTTLPGAGLLLVMGSVLGLREVVVSGSQPEPLPKPLLVGLLVLIAAGFFSAIGGTAPLGALVGVVGAWEVATSTGLPGFSWVGPLVVATTAVGGVLIMLLDRRWATEGMGPILLAISIGGLYATVPETILVSVLVGVAGPIAILGLLRIASIGASSAYAVAGFFAWAAAMGGAGRASSIVGGVGCLGLLLVDPVARRLANGPTLLDVVPRWWRLTMSAFIQLACVAAASRIAGTQRSLGWAVFIVVSELVVAVALLVGGGRTLKPRLAEPEQELEHEARVAGNRV
jgi:hypothetical protein